MFTIHVLLLAAAAVLVAAVSAGHTNLRRRGDDLPLMGFIIGGALVVGNAACLLPSAPAWYRVAMIAVSLAGLTWFLVSAASSTEKDSADSDAELIARDIYAGRIPTRPVPARPALRVVKATPVDEPVEEPQAPVVAAQETFHAASPQGSRATTGATYVAADIDNYIDARGTRTAHGRHAARTHTKTDPTERFLRLAEVYSIDRGPRSLGRSALS